MQPATLARLLDDTVEAIRSTDPADLPLLGKHWTLRVTDEAVLLRIELAGKKVNGTPVKRETPKPPPRKGGK
jgi:hypothetical protein